MPVLKNPQPELTTDSSKTKAAHLFHMLITQTSTQDSISCVNHDSLHTRPPSQLNASNKATDNSKYQAEYMETFQQLARNCTIPLLPSSASPEGAEFTLSSMLNVHGVHTAGTAHN